MKFKNVAQPIPMAAPIANDGDKNIIPLNSTKTNLASLKDGFPEITQKSPDEGGLPPVRADFNGMFYLSTDQRIYLQNGGVITFSQAVSDEIGGYPKGAVLDFVDDKSHVYKKVRSLIDDNNYDFVKDISFIDGIHWEELKFGAGGSGVELGTVVCVPFGVDESENKYRYLNGQIMIQTQYPEFTAKVKKWQETRSSLFTTETNWQAEKTASVLGQCGKFVIDDTAGTIRLPLVININGLTDLSKVGVIKDESLPDPNSKLYSIWAGGTGTGGNQSIIAQNYSGSVQSAPSTGSTYIKVDNSTYKNNAPVQQEAIQYPYVICVNTGVEEAERPINDYTVNNPYAYGMSQYCQGAMNNNSWLKSNGQWNRKAVYPSFYDWAFQQLSARQFDPSKITVVGSPTITDDGIASGFSTDNYLKFPNFDTSKPWNIRFKFNCNKYDEIQGLIRLNTEQNVCVMVRPNGVIFFRNRFFDPNIDLHSNTNFIQLNTDYICDIGWTGTMYYLKINNNLISSIDSTEVTILTNTFWGTGQVGYYSTTSNIDLKQFSITVDGDEVYSPTKRLEGFKCSTEEYDDYDFVINTADETFRLPIKAINSNYKYSYFPDFNNKTDLTTNFIAPNNGWFLLKAGTQGAVTSINGVEVQNSFPSGANYSDRNIFIRVKKGDIATAIGGGGYFVPEIVVKETDSNGLFLYYYCGDTLQNVDLINIARIEEKLTDINAPTRGYLVESYVNGLSGYRLYSDGYCEQWGHVPPQTTANENYPITFVKKYKDTNYNIKFGFYTNTNGGGGILIKGFYMNSANKTVNGFTKYADMTVGWYWTTSGYLAEGQS